MNKYCPFSLVSASGPISLPSLLPVEFPFALWCSLHLQTAYRYITSGLSVPIILEEVKVVAESRLIAYFKTPASKSCPKFKRKLQSRALTYAGQPSRFPGRSFENLNSIQSRTIAQSSSKVAVEDFQQNISGFSRKLF